MDTFQCLSGTVLKQSARAGRLGFPTANLLIKRPFPEEGVFVSVTRISGDYLMSLSHFGASPTFNESYRKFETHILNFDGTLYDKHIEVILLKKLRETQTFDSKEQLISQLKEDRSQAEAYFDKHPSLISSSDYLVMNPNYV